MRDCSMSEKEEKWDMMAEVELGEMMMLWVDGQRDIKIEFWTLMNKVVTLEHQKMEREKVLKEGEKLDVGKEFKSDEI